MPPRLLETEEEGIAINSIVALGLVPRASWISKARSETYEYHSNRLQLARLWMEGQPFGVQPLYQIDFPLTGITL